MNPDLYGEDTLYHHTIILSSVFKLLGIGDNIL